MALYILLMDRWIWEVNESNGQVVLENGLDAVCEFRLFFPPLVLNILRGTSHIQTVSRVVFLASVQFARAASRPRGFDRWRAEKQPTVTKNSRWQIRLDVCPWQVRKNIAPLLRCKLMHYYKLLT